MPHGNHNVSTTGFWVEHCPVDNSVYPPRMAFRPTQSFLSRTVVSGALLDRYMPAGTRLRDGDGVRWMAVDVPKYGRVLAEMRTLTDEEAAELPKEPEEEIYVFVEPLHVYRPKKTGTSFSEEVVKDY